MAFTNQPAVVVVHGAWHISQHYELLCKSLQNAGFLAICPQLPSQSNNHTIPPTQSLPQDVAEIRKKITEFSEANHPIILLMHSYGGQVGSNACENLLWGDRQGKGLKGGIIHVIYMAAFVIPSGTANFDPFGGEVPPGLDYNPETELLTLKNPRDSLYSHLNDEDAGYWVEKLVKCPTQVGKDKITYAPYDRVGKDLDATFLVCKSDKELAIEVQEQMASLLGKESRLEYVDSGHCAQIGAQNQIVEVVEKAWEVSKVNFIEK